MGTSGVVGADIGIGLRGRRVAYDADPNIIVPTLRGILAVNGFTAAARTLLRNDWVFIDDTTTANYVAAGGGTAIPGYGVPVDPHADPAVNHASASSRLWRPVDIADGSVDAAYGFYIHRDGSLTVQERAAHTICRIAPDAAYRFETC